MSTSHNWWANHTEYYYDAFAAQYRTIWHGWDPVADSMEELAWRSYYRALVAFLRSDPESITDRRRLLYYYLRPEFKTQSADDTLNRYRKQLPVDTTVRRVVRNLCSAYDESPTRELGEVLPEIYAKMRVASVLPTIHQRARMTGLVAVRPVYVNGKWSLDYMTPDEFTITTDPNDWRTVTALTYVRASESNGIEYVTWTADERIVTDYNGRSTTEPNLYQRIPWVFLRLGDNDGVYPAGMMELVEAQLDNNKIKWLSNMALTFAGAPVWLAINMGRDHLTLSPDKIVSINGVTAGEGQDVPPMLEPINPEAAYQDIDDFRAIREKIMQQAEGIPASMVADGQGQPPSGIARLIERQELTEIRYSDQKALREFEAELADVVALVAQTDAGTIVPAFDFQIQFQDEPIYMEPKDEYELDKTKLADGVIAPDAFYRKWAGLTGEEAEIMSEIDRRKAVLQNLTINPPQGNVVS